MESIEIYNFNNKCDKKRITKAVDILNQFTLMEI